MNEFQTQKGGRKIFNEDFDSLQKLITSAIGFFSDCGLNYVISGCNVTNDKVLSGYVFLNGKIRKVEETAIKNSLRPVIIPTYSTIEGEYENGTTGILRENYGTKIVGATEYYTGDCIQSVKNDVGMYSFKGIKDTFWKYYMLIKDSNDIQQLFNDIEFKQIVHSINMIIKESGKEIKIDNTGSIFSIQGTDNGNKSFSVEFKNDGSITFSDSEKNSFSINIISDDIINLDNLIAQEINLDSLEFENLILQGHDVIEESFTNGELGDTEWKHVLKVSTNEPVANLYVRSFLNEVIIQGTLPVDFLSSVEKKDGDAFNSKTKIKYYIDYKLPDGVKTPLVPKSVAFCVISNTKGTMGANIYIDESGRFYLVEDTFYKGASYNGVGQCSFPIGNNQVNISDGIPEFPSGDMMSPSIVWNFFTDVPVKLCEIVRNGRLKGDIAYNAETNTLHCWMKYYETATIKDLSTNTVHTEKTVKNLKVAKISLLIPKTVDGKEVWSEDPANPNYPISPKKEVVEGYNSEAGYKTTWESSGYAFHSPYSSQDVKVKVTYETSLKNEYDGTPTQELLIRKSPSNYYLSIEPNYTTEVIMGNNKKVCRTVTVKSQCFTYYEMTDADGDRFGYEETFGALYTLTDRDGALKLYKTGNKDFVNDVFEFTDRAVNYLGKIDITVDQLVSDKTADLHINKRDCVIKHIN